MTEHDTSKGYLALFGWSLHALDAMERFNRKYIVVAPPWAEDHARENGIPFISWDFTRINERSGELHDQLKEEGVDVCVPLFEETVEWAGAINSRLMSRPRLFNQAMLFRNKAMMKRRAQMSGIRVGVFEVADNREDVLRFLQRVNEALLKLDGDLNDPIHIKPFDRAGTLGHRLISSHEDVAQIHDDEFPCLMESHLDGKELACEVFIKNRQIQFLNISEYVHLGYSVFVPAGPEIEQWRSLIRGEIEKLIEAFDIDWGFIHPEYFITNDGRIHFGEVAYRVPGGNAFELIERAYGFNAYQGLAMCFDPYTTQEELDNFFPREVVDAKGHAGCFLVYPKKRVISDIQIPDVVESDPYFERQELFMPAESKVPERAAFGNHYGTIYFFGDKSDRMREVLLEMEEYDFYI